MEYRQLNLNEIRQLQNQGCSAQEWRKILVPYDFNADNVQNIRFVGEVKIGHLFDYVEVQKGVRQPSGLYRSSIQNCTIGDHVYIADVTHLSNYEIAEKAVIANVGDLLVTGETTFGNGVTIEVLNEGGGRELVIFDQLSAQFAYLMVNYRHDAGLITALQSITNDYVNSKKNVKGFIGRHARIMNCTHICNVNIGEYAQVTGAIQLYNGTIASVEADPSSVGHGVIAKDFIILSGSKVDGTAMLDRCFVGQGVKIGKQYSAENSAFFANCEGFHGEACSIFAGPYTVTHHKSTLLIASLFSFYNAGSGTNQSNHMYKLGPIHQGIVERGSKTGSFSYMLWPSRVGAFSVVMGKHYTNFDTSDLPFSYINEEEGKTVVTPAMNLFTVGTRRDTRKWPSRDRRKATQKLDIIDFELFSPYIVGKILRGIQILTELQEKATPQQEFVKYKGALIKRLMLKSCRKYYEMAIKIFVGMELLERLEEHKEVSKFTELIRALNVESTRLKPWLDVAGMFIPQNDLNAILEQLKSRRIRSVAEFNHLLGNRTDYRSKVWAWCVALVENRLAISFSDLTAEHFEILLTDMSVNLQKLNNMILKDAEKEFDQNSKIGFGIDGNEEIVNADFAAIRGSFDDNKFVKEVQQESQTVEVRVNQALTFIRALK